MEQCRIGQKVMCSCTVILTTSSQVSASHCVSNVAVSVECTKQKLLDRRRLASEFLSAVGVHSSSCCKIFSSACDALMHDFLPTFLPCLCPARFQFHKASSPLQVLQACFLQTWRQLSGVVRPSATTTTTV